MAPFSLFLIVSQHFRLYDTCLLLGSPMHGMPGAQSGPVPIVRMYGVTQQGNSVLAHVHGFASYFFVPAPQGFKEEDCSKFRVGLCFDECPNHVYLVHCM